MKLRIFENCLRFRLGPTDIKGLVESKNIEHRIKLGPLPDASLSYSLEIREDEQWNSSFENGRIEIGLPNKLAQEWASSDSVGIRTVLDLDGLKLTLLIEKDFTCLVAREGQDDSDTFANPHAKERN